MQRIIRHCKFDFICTDINRIVNFIYFINKIKMYFYLSNNEGIT